jgi:hypothetical protein
MGVELFITRKGVAEPSYYSLTGATGWEQVWLPAAQELGPTVIPLLGNGALGNVGPEQLPEVMFQLSRLREWMAAKGHAIYVEHLDDILAALAKIRPGQDEVSFG